MAARFLPIRAIALSCLLYYADAVPGITPNLRSLTKRYNTFVNCDERQMAKASQAAADMANLALHAYDEANTDSYGFKHYFRDKELDKFKGAMSAIQRNNDPTNAPYNFIIDCAPTGDIGKQCGDKIYAITDASVPRDDNDHKSIWLCPLFFGKGDAEKDLPNTEDADQLKAWCKQKDYTFFPTAGHVLLHEITHLDAVAKLWSPDKVDGMGRHGMEDFAKSSKPIQDARRLKVFFDNEPNREDEIEPAFNAESYAGAATELWAQKFGKKDFIPPKRGYKT